MLKTLCFPVLGNKHVAAVQCHQPAGSYGTRQNQGLNQYSKVTWEISSWSFYNPESFFCGMGGYIANFFRFRSRFQHNHVLEVCHEGMQHLFRKNTQIGVTRLLGGSIDLETKKMLLRHSTVHTTRFHTSQCLRHNFWCLYFGPLTIFKSCLCAID